MNRTGRTILACLLLLMASNLLGLQAVCASGGPDHCEHGEAPDHPPLHEFCPGDICHAAVSLAAPLRLDEACMATACLPNAGPQPQTGPPAGLRGPDREAPIPRLARPAGAFPLLI